ncbi:MAG: hypothetical protein QW273_00470 [Candidatus Pacearchaeota archaeon]
MEEKKVKLISLSYYSRKEVKEYIFNFCKKRETIPKYYDFFGKRPDILDYPDDVYSLAKKGATSFHCSQEIWKNPLEIKTEFTREEYNRLREGWDLLIDIDSKYLDYSKLAAKLIIKALNFKGVRNYGIKFSGSKGFHIIIPWKSFPEEINGIKTKEMFPEWARLISNYVDSLIREKLKEEITSLNTNENAEKEVVYLPTKEIAEQKKFLEYSCYLCNLKASFILPLKTKKRIFRCSFCNNSMTKEKEEIIFVSKNGDNSKKNPQNFKEIIKTENLIDSIDLVLVSSRHLFRAPYSLHEKTALSSCVISEKELETFVPKMADPLRISIREYYPECKKEEARRLLIDALDWEEKRHTKIKRDYAVKEINLEGVTINESFFPPTILKILEGIKRDGRKRALTILLSFFSSLNLPKEYIEEKIEEWNKKNYQPLKENYIKAQIEWFSKNKRLPPNYDKPIYKELGVFCGEDKFKNPINYTIREILKRKKSNYKSD